MFENLKNNILDWKDELLCDKKRLMGILLILALLVASAVLKLNQNNNNNVVVEAQDEEVYTSEIYVDIGGAVNSPGVYKVDDGTRLYELIEKAGGLTEDANIDAINRAEFVEDGQKITVPVISSSDDSETSDSGDSTANNGLININTASAEELKELTGVGDAIAQRIIDYRSSNTFKSKEDIMCVKGIGSATYEKLKDDICV